MKRLIVGGVAGDASAAARARRLSEDAQIILFERGPDVSFANGGLPCGAAGLPGYPNSPPIGVQGRHHRRRV